MLKKVAEKPKIIKKIKAATLPVKIDWDLPPMHTAFIGTSHLIPKIKESSPYKLLEHPQVLGTELGYEEILEVMNILQNSGLLKDGGKVKK